MDRDAAIGTDGAQLAKDIMENELVMGTDAYKTEMLFTWSTRQCGTQQKAESVHWILCFRIWRACFCNWKENFTKYPFYSISGTRRRFPAWRK